MHQTVCLVEIRVYKHNKHFSAVVCVCVYNELFFAMELFPRRKTKYRCMYTLYIYYMTCAELMFFGLSKSAVLVNDREGCLSHCDDYNVN